MCKCGKNEETCKLEECKQNINWKRKLTSRKFWAAAASFVSMMIMAIGGSQDTASQTTALIMAGASVIAYIIGEGLTDSSNKLPDVIQLEHEEIKKED